MENKQMTKDPYTCSYCHGICDFIDMVNSGYKCIYCGKSQLSVLNDIKTGIEIVDDINVLESKSVTFEVRDDGIYRCENKYINDTLDSCSEKLILPKNTLVEAIKKYLNLPNNNIIDDFK